jgi:hypothetical protein
MEVFMKFKALFIASAIAMSGAANAAIDGPTSTGASVNSDLVLFVYDTVKDLSYVQNLNVNYKDIIALNGSFTGSYNLDAAALNIFSTSSSSNLVWGMASTGLDYTDADGSTLGLVLTANNPAVTPTPVDLSAIAAANGKFNDLAVAANLFTAIGTANAADASGAAASQLSAGVNHFYDHIGLAVGFTNSANVSAAQNLWFVHSSADYDVAAPSLASANTWALNLGDLSHATLSSAPVAPVPLPAAAWLMFSALMGLGGIARRRNAKV